MHRVLRFDQYINEAFKLEDEKYGGEAHYREFTGRRYKNHSNILSPDEIIDYLEKIPPTPEGLPHQSWIDSIKNCNSNFVLKEIKIQDILEMDPNIAGYVKAKGNRYEFEKDLDLKNLENPIIIFDGQVLDGYNRISVKHKNGDKKIKAYIA